MNLLELHPPTPSTSAASDASMPLSPPRRPPVTRRAAAVTGCTAVISAAAVVAGVLEARLPVGPGNTVVDHGYPFFAVGMAAVLTVVGIRSRGAAPRWSLLARLDGWRTPSTPCSSPSCRTP